MLPARRSLPLSRSPVIAVLMVIAGLGALSLQDVFMKGLTARYSAFELLALRTCFSLLAFALTLVVLRRSAPLRTRRLGTQVLRGTTLLISLTCFYIALTVMPLLDVVALFFTAPIIAAALAAWLLGERATGDHWVAVAVGFTGALLMVRPGSGVMQTASLIGLVAAFFYAVSLLLSRRLGSTEAAATTAYYSLLCYLVLSLCAAGAVELLASTGTLTLDTPLLKRWVNPPFIDLLQLAFCGVMVAIGFFCLAHAYRLANVTLLAPFEYTGIIWSGALAYLAWRDVPSATTWIGATLIVVSGVYIAVRAARA